MSEVHQLFLKEQMQPAKISILADTPIANVQTIYQAYVHQSQNASSLSECVIKKTVVDNSVAGTEDVEVTWAGPDQFSFNKAWSDRTSLTYSLLEI